MIADEYFHNLIFNDVVPNNLNDSTVTFVEVRSSKHQGKMNVFLNNFKATTL